MKRKLQILLAEDNVSDLLKMCLSRGDNALAEFHFVRDGQEATNYLRGEGKFSDRFQYPFPELVILDVNMPQVSGFEVLTWLRTDPRCQHLPVVMLSGFGLPEDVVRAYALGANSYFQKPATVDAFTALLSAVVHYWWLAERPDSVSNCG